MSAAPRPTPPCSARSRRSVDLVSLDSVLEAIRRAFPGKVGEANIEAAKAAHALVTAKAAA